EVSCTVSYADGTLTIRNGQETLIAADVLYGSGRVKVYVGEPGRSPVLLADEERVAENLAPYLKYFGICSAEPAGEENQAVRTRSGSASCPVDVQIVDENGRVVKTLTDGVEEEGEGDFGYYCVFRTEAGDYSKHLLLNSEKYRIALVASGDGLINFQTQHYDPESDEINAFTVGNVPVTAGAVFRPVDDPSSSRILQVDWEGDGSIDEAIGNETTVHLPETQLTLALGSTRQLSASVSPASCGLLWASTDESVVTVTDDGLLTAVGTGEARVGVIAVNGSNAAAACTVTVPKGMYSAADFTVSGLQQRYVYTGQPIEPALQVSYQAVRLTEGVDYTLTRRDHLLPGTASITLQGQGNYTGSQTLTFEIYEKTASTVQEKVEEIVAECLDRKFEDEYETALWLHDWLVNNANYDYTYTYYGAEGVLLHKTGVCQSYTLAYQMLLNAMGIENTTIVSPEMDHTWNLVRIDGEWCHIDCTWDDPGVGGAECYSYFGMNDALISRDHTWPSGDEPACQSLQNYYYLRSGAACVATAEELEACLNAAAEKTTEEVFVCYVGENKDFDIVSAFESWYGRNNARCGIKSYSVSFTQYALNCTLQYTEPWQDYEGLPAPVDCPAFSLRSPSGVYHSSQYSANGLVLIFGRDGCMNTHGLLDRLHSEISLLNQGGVDVLITLEGASSGADLEEQKAQYPGFRYAYDALMDGTLSSLLEAVNYNEPYITYPVVFIISNGSQITYFSTD
ncbi:MAG: Ig-like domain-containing protein, partial [Clostridia bacterium]|nr:Ig-like domain-containing protein [Clostridia bacterium]